MDTLEIEEIAPIKVAKETMEHYPDAIYVNLWDREYMPSGMWATFGEAVGMLVGGNLAVLSGLISTPYDIFTPGRILFIEDIGEEVYKVERMLHTLRLNGVLAGLQGLVVGRFTNYHSPDRNGETMEQMISRMVEPYGYPVAFDFPLGHVDDNRPLIEGCMARLSVYFFILCRRRQGRQHRPDRARCRSVGSATGRLRLPTRLCFRGSAFEPCR